MSAIKNVEPGFVLPRSEWHRVLEETAIEVFSVMVGVVVAPTDHASRGAMQVTGVVGIAGAIRANLIVQCSHESAIKLASQMLGISPDAADAETAACDALGEICNIVAGYFKAKVGLGDTCMLSVPTIITGQDYRFCSRETYERIELSLLFEGKAVAATLEIAQ
jgi:CheY-specific phosphatase CheX